MKSEKLKRSVAQEKRVAAQMGGSVNPQSGAGWIRKNDVRGAQEYLIECKGRTDPKAKSITLKLDDLQNVETNGLLEGRTPVLSFELGGRDYFVLTDVDFEVHRHQHKENGTNGGSTMEHRQRGAS